MNFIQSLLSRRYMMAGMATSAALVASTSGEAKQPKVKATRHPVPSRPPLRSVGNLATASVDDWAQHVGTTFETSTGHKLRLVEVREFDNRDKRPAGVRERPFAAGFDIVSGRGALPEQLTLRVNHKVGGTFDMFVTAATPESPQRRVAVFA
jgi:hypothetical protein